jgi:hypothetical protein
LGSEDATMEEKVVFAAVALLYAAAFAEIFVLGW